MLRVIGEQAPSVNAATETLGSNPAAGWILLSCKEAQCGAAGRAARKLNMLIASKSLPQPTRSIRVASTVAPESIAGITAVIHVAEAPDRPFQVVRGLWSTASLVDEVVELFARHGGTVVDARAYESLGQPPFDSYGIPTATIVVNPAVSNDQAAFAAAASAYFLATLPNAGSEALLSHLMVGAHARLADDGRKAVAQMGSQQRASGEVLTMYANAIDREQRRMRSFERFMPAPVDPILHSRIVDMENGITGVWTSIGITPSPYVPPAERIRGRGGEDRRVPSRTRTGPMAKPELPTAFLKFENVDTVVAELGNFVDGQRSISDIRDAVSAEFAPIALPVVVEYFERLATLGAITIKQPQTRE
ncbi:MAG: hypothetical protein ABI039_12000, partial [Vicinamibacterales bacterium]